MPIKPLSVQGICKTVLIMVPHFKFAFIMVEEQIRDTSALDRANFNPEIVSEATSPHNPPSTVDFGGMGSQSVDINMQRLHCQQNHSLLGTQAQVHHQIEAKASSDRTVRYSDAQPRQSLSEQANSTRKQARSLGKAYLRLPGLLHQYTNVDAYIEADDHLQWPFRHWILHSKWHHPQSSRPTSTLPGLFHPHGFGVGGDAVYHRKCSLCGQFLEPYSNSSEPSLMKTCPRPWVLHTSTFSTQMFDIHIIQSFQMWCPHSTPRLVE